MTRQSTVTVLVPLTEGSEVTPDPRILRALPSCGSPGMLITPSDRKVFLRHPPESGHGSPLELAR